MPEWIINNAITLIVTFTSIILILLIFFIIAMVDLKNKNNNYKKLEDSYHQIFIINNDVTNKLEEINKELKILKETNIKLQNEKEESDFYVKDLEQKLEETQFKLDNIERLQKEKRSEAAKKAAVTRKKNQINN